MLHYVYQTVHVSVRNNYSVDCSTVTISIQTDRMYDPYLVTLISRFLL